MAEARLERLMNLVALLSDTRRALSLDEIVHTVPGYPESKSASQRAFLRDKDDLKAMNFDVVLTETPNGESGYIIRKESTYFDLKLSSAQRNIVEYALALYGPEKKLAENAITKLGGMNPENEIGEVTSLPIPKYVDELFQAISEMKTINITFKGTQRSLIPRKVIARSGYWYLEADDLVKKQSRTFRIDRIEAIYDSTLDLATQDVQDYVDEEQPASIEFVVKTHPSLIEQFSKQWNGKADLKANRVVFSVPRSEVFTSRIFEYSGFVAVIEPKDIADEILERMNLATSAVMGVK